MIKECVINTSSKLVNDFSVINVLSSQESFSLYLLIIISRSFKDVSGNRLIMSLAKVLASLLRVYSNPLLIDFLKLFIVSWLFSI